MKICVIAQVEPSLDYGGGKAQYFLTQEWKRAGHQVDVYGFKLFKAIMAETGPPAAANDLTQAFEYFLENGADAYDVIDYDFRTFPRKVPHLPNTLLVARSVLFKRSSKALGYPQSPRFRHRLKRGFHEIREKICPVPSDNSFSETLPKADLINVTSKLDLESAKEMGIAGEQICHFPYALSSQTIAEFEKTPGPGQADSPQIVFLGSFDFRKGCIDLAKAFHLLRKTFPEAGLTILGAKGLHRTESQVRYFFSGEDNPHVHVHMRFDPDKLVDYLANKHLALFPSYNEGFPFSVQETLAAGLPTLAYGAAGAADILPDQWLLQCGDYRGLATKAIELLRHYDTSLRRSANSCVKQFVWSEIADSTLRLYEAKLAAKKRA